MLRDTKGIEEAASGKRSASDCGSMILGEDTLRNAKRNYSSIGVREWLPILRER